MSDLSAFAKDILERLPKKEGATLLSLSGDLGAGKTTFVQALAKELGVEETVQSPTYVLMKSYLPTRSPFKKLVHLDLYRLEKPEEFAALKPESFLNEPGALIAVEWPERVGEALPKADLLLKFSADGAQASERYIELV